MWLSNVLVFALLIGGSLQRGRGGAPGAGPRAGTVEHAMVLDRNVTVYLPPSYLTDAARRFPVIYFLHDNREQTDDPINGIKEAADKLASVQGFSESIVVAPDIDMTAGDSERFIAEDLVAYIDMHYRTLAKRISRGLAGHAMGAYGALRIGMKRSDVFSSVYSMSACCLDAKDFTIEQNAANLKKLYGIAIEIGAKDASLPANRQLHEAMARLHIPHSYEEYEGDQTSKARERYERNLLPFFSRNLAAPANPTSPAVQ